jgi:hypothetical protein
VGTGIANGVINLSRERGVTETKSRDGKIVIIGVEGKAITDTLKVLDVRGDRLGREVIHALVKMSMKINLDPLSLNIIP